MSNASTDVAHIPSSPIETDESQDPTIYNSISQGPELRKFVEKSEDFITKLRKGYQYNSLLSKVILEPEHYKTFSHREGVLYSKNRGGDKVLCIPRHITNDYSLTATIIEQAHTILGHFGPQNTGDYIRRWYWWPKLQQEVEKFCYSCRKCQATNTSTQHPLGLLHPLPTPTKPWSSIDMDFSGPFPRLKGYDYLWVVICRLTLMVHLIPVNTTTTASKLA